MQYILVTRYGGTGDLVMLEPTIRALHAKQNPCKIILRTYSDYLEVLKEHPLVYRTVLDNNQFNLWPAANGLTPIKANTYLGEVELHAGDTVQHYNFHGVIERRNDVHGVRAFSEHAEINLYADQPCLPTIEGPRYFVVVQIRAGGNDRDLTRQDLPLVLSTLSDVVIIDRILPMQEYKRLIANASMFIGSDSSGLHLAAAYGVPQIIGLYSQNFPPKIRAYQNIKAFTCLKDFQKWIERQF